MPPSLVVIISGAPATGKTTLGRRLAAELRLPFIGKDDIKETLFETLGWSDRAWSRKLGGATYELLYHLFEVELRVGRSFVAESNFRPNSDGARWQALQRRYGFKAFQVLCATDREALLERYHRRTISGERHPGHVDHMVLDEMRANLDLAEFGALPLDGSVVEIDTTDFASVDYAGLLAEVKAAALI